ncbi:unnamed protein product [Rotaria socialis]
MRRFVHATICPCDDLSMQRFVHATTFLQRFVRDILSATFCPRRFVLQRFVLRRFVHATFCPQRIVRNVLSRDDLSGHRKNNGCGTRVLHEHSNQIYHRISEGRISKVLKASSACGQIRPAFSNKGPRKIIQAKQVFERFQVDLVDLSRRPVTHDGFEFRYALVVLDIFSRYLFLRALKKKSSVIVYIMIFNRHAVFRTFINQE